jgi:hypothetical protein
VLILNFYANLSHNSSPALGRELAADGLVPRAPVGALALGAAVPRDRVEWPLPDQDATETWYRFARADLNARSGERRARALRERLEPRLAEKRREGGAEQDGDGAHAGRNVDGRGRADAVRRAKQRGAQADAQVRGARGLGGSRRPADGRRRGDRAARDRPPPPAGGACAERLGEREEALVGALEQREEPPGVEAAATGLCRRRTALEEQDGAADGVARHPGPHGERGGHGGGHDGRAAARATRSGDAMRSTAASAPARAGAVGALGAPLMNCDLGVQSSLTQLLKKKKKSLALLPKRYVTRASQAISDPTTGRA